MWQKRLDLLRFFVSCSKTALGSPTVTKLDITGYIHKRKTYYCAWVAIVSSFFGRICGLIKNKTP